MKKLVLLITTLIFLAGCGIDTPDEVNQANEVSQPELIDGRLSFQNFDSFANYWADLINQNEDFLDAAEQRAGYTSQRSALEASTEAETLAADNVHADPYLQTILNEQGLVQIADRVFLVTGEDVISIPSEVLPEVDLNALALGSANLQAQNIQSLGIAYSPIEWITPEASADGDLGTQGIVSAAVWAFVKKYIIPQASGTVDTCNRTYWKGSGIYQYNHRRRVIGVSGAAKLTWIKLPGNPAVLGTFAGTGNANVAYLPDSGVIHVNQSKNFRVTGTPVRELYSRIGTYKVSGATASAVGRVTYWAAGSNLTVQGTASTTHTVSDKGKTGVCHTSLAFNLR